MKSNQELAEERHKLADKLLSKEKEDRNHITTQLDKENVTSFNTGYFHGFKAAFLAGIEVDR